MRSLLFDISTPDIAARRMPLLQSKIILRHQLKQATTSVPVHRHSGETTHPCTCTKDKRTYTHIHAYIHIHMHARIRTHRKHRTHTHMHTCTHRTHTHAYAYVYTHHIYTIYRSGSEQQQRLVPGRQSASCAINALENVITSFPPVNLTWRRSNPKLVSVTFANNSSSGSDRASTSDTATSAPTATVTTGIVIESIVVFGTHAPNRNAAGLSAGGRGRSSSGERHVPSVTGTPPNGLEPLLRTPPLPQGTQYALRSDGLDQVSPEIIGAVIVPA